MNERPTHLDLFSGIGGFSLAFESAGFTTVAFAENEPVASQILKHHWPNVPNYGDIRNVPIISGIDVVSAGFPCQPFSDSGRKLGERDSRHLWPTVVSTLSKIRPNWFLGENVTGIKNMVLARCLVDLESLGYQCAAFDIPACATGLQTVERHVWIVAARDNNGFQGNSEKSFQGIEISEAEWRKVCPVVARQRGFADLSEPKLLRTRKGFSDFTHRIRIAGNATDPCVPFVFARAIYQEITK